MNNEQTDCRIDSPVAPRRFSAIDRLYGSDRWGTFMKARVMVVGIGGVGSWAVEALARSGVGRITLVDLDHVAESNINRQVQADDESLGSSKVEAMARRVARYAPDCLIDCVDDFLKPDTVEEILSCAPDAVIDAMDDVLAKRVLISACRQLNVPLVVSGAAGGKMDPTHIRVADLSESTHDPLLAKLRGQLRKVDGFAKTGKMRVPVVYSSEPRQGSQPPTVDPGARLACAGYGSAVTVTAPLGFAAAAWVLNQGLKARIDAKSPR